MRYFFTTINLKPLPHQTAMPQRLYSVLKTYQRAVGSPQNTSKTSNFPVIACTQRLHSALSNTLCKRKAAVFVLSMF